MKKWCVRLAVLPLLVSAAACVGTSKSSNPLSPSIAGPISGVGITAPTIVAPAVDAMVDTNAQPITLLVGNAETNGVRPLSYRFEIATDPNFANQVFIKDSIAQDGSGRTSMTLPGPLSPERKYFWHARAEDGANTGPFGATSAFNVFTPVVFGAPTLLAPINDVTTSNQQPKFVIGNAAHSGPVGPVAYYLEVSKSSSFSPLVASYQFLETGTQSELTAPVSLPSGQYFWRARAFDGGHNGPFSGIQSFRTPAAGGGGGGGGGGSGGNGHVAPGPLTVDRAQQVVFGTANEFPNLMTVAGADELLRRTIWHLQLAGYQAARQKNPSGAISSDKLCLFIDGAWHAYDIYSLNDPLSVHFLDEVFPANPVADGGIPD